MFDLHQCGVSTADKRESLRKLRRRYERARTPGSRRRAWNAWLVESDRQLLALQKRELGGSTSQQALLAEQRSAS